MKNMLEFPIKILEASTSLSDPDFWIYDIFRSELPLEAKGNAITIIGLLLKNHHEPYYEYDYDNDIEREYRGELEAEIYKFLDDFPRKVIKTLLQSEKHGIPYIKKILRSGKSELIYDTTSAITDETRMYFEDLIDDFIFLLDSPDDSIVEDIAMAIDRLGFTAKKALPKLKHIMKSRNLTLDNEDTHCLFVAIEGAIDAIEEFEAKHKGY